MLQTSPPPKRLATTHEVVLRDGSTLHVRPLEPADEDALHDFFCALSPDSRAFRFLSLGVNLRAAARHAAEVDGRDRVGLVAMGPGGRIVAHAMYVRIDPESAEVAFAVADAWQGHGLGTVLLGLVADIASRAGIPQFVALVRADNRRMVDVFRQSGFPASVRARSGVVEVELPTALGAEALAAFEDRDRVAATSAVARFLLPRSVALIGASDRPGSVGAALLQNLRGSFTGPIHLVNRRRAEVGGTPALRSVAQLPEAVDLAVVAVPARGVEAVARAARGVRRLRGRRRRRGAPGAAARPLPADRHAPHRAQLPRARGDGGRACARRDVRTALARAGAGRPLDPERRHRDRGDRGRPGPGAGLLLGGLDRGSPGPVDERSPPVLGVRRRNPRDRALRRVLRQPAQLRSCLLYTSPSPRD